MAAGTHVLVVGYGNVLRGDDGVGQEVAEAIWLQRDRLPGLARARVIWVTQLTPELALDVSDAGLAVFVDAACDGRPVGSVSVEVLPGPSVEPADKCGAEPGGPAVVAEGGRLSSGAGCWQDVSAAGLLRLAAELFGRAPVGVMVTVSVACTGAGEGLSPLVSAAVPRAVAAVRMAIAASLRRDGGARPLSGARPAAGGRGA